MDIYAPLAGRLGMSKIKNELEDLSFQYLEPDGYRELLARVEERRRQATAFIAKVKGALEERLQAAGLSASVEGRIKRLYSIHQKLKRQRIDLDQVYDFVALRVLVATIPDCYAVLGILHNLWRPVPGRIKDFIAMPRPNGYQSLHTSVIGEEGHPFEVQIRTQEMHRVAEEGIAAHWKYKEGRTGFDKDDQAFAWLRQLLEWQQEVKDPHEFLNSLEARPLSGGGLLLHPQGRGEDAAARGHPHRLRLRHPHRGGPPVRGRAGQRQDGAPALPLKNGDIIEILTAPGHHPSRDWLAATVTNKARSKIRHYLNTAEKQQALEIGRKHFERELKRYDLSLKKLEADKAEALAQELGVGARLEDIFAAVGYGKVSMRQVLSKLLPPEKLRRAGGRAGAAPAAGRGGQAPACAWARSASPSRGRTTC